MRELVYTFRIISHRADVNFIWFTEEETRHGEREGDLPSVSQSLAWSLDFPHLGFFLLQHPAFVPEVAFLLLTELGKATYRRDFLKKLGSITQILQFQIFRLRSACYGSQISAQDANALIVLNGRIEAWLLSLECPNVFISGCFCSCFKGVFPPVSRLHSSWCVNP